MVLFYEVPHIRPWVCSRDRFVPVPDSKRGNRSELRIESRYSRVSRGKTLSVFNEVPHWDEC